MFSERIIETETALKYNFESNRLLLVAGKTSTAVGRYAVLNCEAETVWAVGVFGMCTIYCLTAGIQ